MTAAETAVDPERPSALDGRASVLETTRIWGAHLLCFVLPVTTLAFALTAPHSWAGALGYFMVIVASVLVDLRAGPETRQPKQDMARWPFDAVLYLLVALQAINLALVLRMVSVHGFWAFDTLIGTLLLGITSGYSGIVVAHELIHRPEARMKLLGRGLLSLVLYEHFFTEHIRGHHVLVGTGKDPATARFGETAHAHFRRNVPGQFRSAWRLEAKRLGDVDMPWYDRRMLRSRVVHGLIAGWGLAAAVLAILGPGAFVIHLLQALVAIRLLECVNYFEHWGLQREGNVVRPIDSWDTSSWFTLYTLVGLSRHADHHACATRPYPQLRHFDESPKLPSGYFGMVVMSIFNNGKAIRLMTEELERRQLGPYAAGAGPAANDGDAGATAAVA